MFIRIFNLVFFLLYSLHFLNIIFIPNEIRYFMMAFYIFINLLGLIKNKFNSIPIFLFPQISIFELYLDIYLYFQDLRILLNLFSKSFLFFSYFLNIHITYGIIIIHASTLNLFTFYNYFFIFLII